MTETFDAGLLGEHVLESLAHAWQNFLTPGHSRLICIACIDIDFVKNLKTFILGLCQLRLSSLQLQWNVSQLAGD